jgi:hypothetical protein
VWAAPLIPIQALASSSEGTVARVTEFPNLETENDYASTYSPHTKWTITHVTVFPQPNICPRPDLEIRAAARSSLSRAGRSNSPEYMCCAKLPGLMWRFIKICITIGLNALLVACDLFSTTPSPETAAAWEVNISEGFINGYTNYTAYWVDGDIGAGLFGYTIPGSKTSEEVFAILKKQSSGHYVEKETSETLILRKKLSYGTNAFDEMNFLFDPVRGRMTVLWGNFDSPTEHAAYPEIIKDMRRRHDGK